MVEQLKINSILNKLLDHSLKISDECADKILKYVQETETGNDFSNNSNIYIKWLNKALNKWENINPSVNLIKFCLETVCILGKSDKKILILNSRNCLHGLLSLLKRTNNIVEENLHVNYVRVLRSLIETKLGLDWVITSVTSWSDVLIINQINESSLFTKELGSFLAGLVLKTMHSNKIFTMNLAHDICINIIDINSQIDNTQTISRETEDLWYKKLYPTLCLLGAIYRSFMENIKNETMYKVILKYDRILNNEQCLCNIINVVSRKDFTLELCKALLPLQFFEISNLIISPNSVSPGLLQSYFQKIVFIFKVNIKRGFVSNVLELCHLGFICWRKIIENLTFIPSSISNKGILLENQIILMQLIPVISMDHTILGNKFLSTFEENLFRDEHLDKVFKQTHCSILHLAYQWREIFQQTKNIVEDVNISIEFILKTKPYYTKSCCVLLFKYFIYSMSDLIIEINEKKNCDTSYYNKKTISLLMDTIITIIKDYDMTWKDSIETIDVLNLSSNFLKLPSLPPELVVRGLKLVELSISKYMSPNLALLVETNDSTMLFIGPLLFVKLHDNDIDVKSCALQVLRTISENAKSKYPYFQKLLKESELHKLIFKIVKSNDNNIIKKNSLKCLQEMVFVDDIWRELSYIEDFQKDILRLLKFETDENVRSEFVNLITVIYERNLFEKHLETELFNQMWDLGIYDSSSKVTMQVLIFWNKVIERLLSEEGMIDNSFPEVTFSRELRKIIVLDEHEIQKRLKKVMNILSLIGGLSVLEENFIVENFNEVSNLAGKLIDNLLELLENYNVNSENVSSMETDNKNNDLDIIDFFTEDLKMNHPNLPPNKKISPQVFLNNISLKKQCRIKKSDCTVLSSNILEELIKVMNIK